MTVTILQGDALAMLRTLPAESVQVVCTSPPYFALRDYGVDGQIGLEQTPGEFIEKLVAVFEEVRRVLRKDGTCWVNLGDSYSGSGKGPSVNLNAPTGGGNPHSQGLNSGLTFPSIPAKNLLLIPERFAIAMQNAGWIVRSRIAWCKKSAMPESVKDRPTSAWEHIWLFSKSRTYYYDAEAVRQAPIAAPQRRFTAHAYGRADYAQNGATVLRDEPMQDAPEGGANMRNFWLLGPEPSREEHYAAFPTEIPKRAILAGTSERGQCPACGAPWRRVVEREKGREVEAPKLGQLAATGVSSNGTGGSTLGIGGKGNGGAWEEHGSKSVTLGWQPSCRCDAGPEAVCSDCGHPGSDHRQKFGCIEATLAPDRETWLGCPCNLELLSPAPVPQTVLDPFLGTGTTALVADRLGRNAVGIELNPMYAEMARRRITNDAPMFANVEVSA